MYHRVPRVVLTLQISRVIETPIFRSGWVVGISPYSQFCPIPSPLGIIFSKKPILKSNKQNQPESRGCSSKFATHKSPFFANFQSFFRQIFNLGYIWWNMMEILCKFLKLNFLNSHSRLVKCRLILRRSDFTISYFSITFEPLHQF